MAIVNGDDGDNTLQGTSDADELRGFGGNDQLFGLGGVDLLIGGLGNDTLDGGSGDDDLRGGEGNDTYVVDHVGDIDEPLVDPGIDTVRASVTYVLGAEQEHLTLTGSANLNGTGNARANKLTGNSGNNLLDSGGGSDRLIGGSGTDTLIGGLGNDTLDGGAGDDDLRGGEGNDTYLVDHAGDLSKALADAGTDTVRSSISYTLGAEQEHLTLMGVANLAGTGNGGANKLIGNRGNNLLEGGGGSDSLIGGSGTDTLIGGLGNDRLDGGVGDDALRGGAGNDTYVVDHAGDLDKGLADAGTDTVRSSISYTLGMQQENLTLTGSGNLNGTGNAGVNTLIGNAGANLLSGGAGADVLLGAGGNDTFIFAANDTRVDGGSGVDTLRLTGANVTADLTGAATYANLEVVDLTGSGDNLLIIDERALLAATAEPHILQVVGDAGDRVEARGFWANAGEVELDGVTYTQYTRGAATLQVGTGVTVAFPSFNLSDLDGTNGFRLEGIDAEDSSGFAVSGAGDVNGDGFDDLIIGAHGADPYGYSNAGETYVVFGKAAGFGASLGLWMLNGTNGFRLVGIDTGDLSGLSVSGAGDVNGDGFDDLIIGAYGADPYGYSEAGESYVVFGKAAGFRASLDLATLNGKNGFRLVGVYAGDYSGLSVSGAGDVNSDGFDDLIIGAYGADPYGYDNAGESYVVFGKAAGFGASLDLATLNGTNGFRLDGIDAGDSSGLSVSGAGDVNGDGFDDLIIGAYGADPYGYSEAGESYVVFGKAAGFGASLDLASLNGTNGFRLVGIDTGDFSGLSVSAAGDVNGDGFGDLIVGAHGADPDGYGYAGETYVVFGKPAGFGASLDLATLNGRNGFHLVGIDGGDYSGLSVSGAGDVNGDGFDDLVIGAYGADPDGYSEAGETYVVFGKAAGFGASLGLWTLDGTNGFRLDGIDAGDLSGLAVSGAGDVNGDGFDDLIIGAPGADPGGYGYAGESYVVFGRDFNNAAGAAGISEAGARTATASVDVAIGALANNALDDAAGLDALVFSAVDRLVEVGSGLDTLVLNIDGVLSTDQGGMEGIEFVLDGVLYAPYTHADFVAQLLIDSDDTRTLV